MLMFIYMYISDSNLSFTDREDFTAKLDGTEDIDPEDLTVCI
jgi:hypothetical protein